MVLVKSMGRRSLLPLVTFATMLGVAPELHAQQEPPALETSQQFNERIRTLTATAKSSPHDYVIGNGDLIGITVFDVPELTRDVRVSQSGTVSIPLVPVRLQIAGLTELQAEQKITEVLEANGLVSHAEVGVMVKEHKSKPITIVGAVMHPMVYEADRSVTLLEAIAEAGGVASDAGDTVIISRSHPATYVEITDPAPIAESTAPGSSAAAPVTSTTAAGEKEKSATVFPNGSDVPQVPATSPDNGAPTTTSSTPPANSSNTITINLNVLMESGDTRNNILLQAGDVVTVPHAGIVYVLGAVSKPGGFVIANDRSQLTAMKVLALAGGLTRIAKLSHAFIIRQNEQGKQTETEVDLKKILDRQAEDLQMRPSDILYIPDDRTKEVMLQTIQLAVAIGTGVAIYRFAYH